MDDPGAYPGFDKLGPMKLRFKRLRADATPPVRAHRSVGYDLTTTEAFDLPPGGQHQVKTGLVIVVPSGHYGRVAPRSGLAARAGIDVLAQHHLVVHLVDVIAGEDHHVFGPVGLDDVDVLVDRVRGAFIPLRL